MMTRAAVAAHLLDYEKTKETAKVAVHRHRIVIAGPVAVAITALIIAIALPKLLIIAGIALVWAGWQVLNWQSTWFVLTNKRIVFARGVFTHNIGMMPLQKVTDMAMQQTWLGQWGGWWKFIVESAGQDQAMSIINFLPYPQQLYLEISNQVFATDRNEELRGTVGLIEGMTPRPQNTEAPSEDDGE